MSNTELNDMRKKYLFDKIWRLRLKKNCKVIEKLVEHGKQYKWHHRYINIELMTHSDV